LPFTPSRLSAWVQTAVKPGSAVLMAGNLPQFSVFIFLSPVR
jgi:hypothetical protein